MLVGYMRASTAEQNVALQRYALLAADIAPKQIDDDTCSGTVANRPGLARALEVARLSPLGFDHINMLGRYASILPDGIARRDLTPLRDPGRTDDEDCNAVSIPLLPDPHA